MMNTELSPFLEAVDFCNVLGAATEPEELTVGIDSSVDGEGVLEILSCSLDVLVEVFEVCEVLAVVVLLEVAVVITLLVLALDACDLAGVIEEEIEFAIDVVFVPAWEVVGEDGNGLVSSVDIDGSEAEVLVLDDS